MTIAHALAFLIFALGALIIGCGAYANWADWKMSRLNELDD